MRLKTSGRGWWMVMMTVTPADAKPDRMSTTRAALLLSSPAQSLTDFASENNSNAVPVAKAESARILYRRAKSQPGVDEDCGRGAGRGFGEGRLSRQSQL